MILKTADDVRDYFTTDIVSEFIKGINRYSDEDKKLLDAEGHKTPRGARLKAELTPVVAKFLEYEIYRGHSIVNKGGFDPSKQSVHFDPFSRDPVIQDWFKPLERQRTEFYHRTGKHYLGRDFVELQTLMMDKYGAFKKDEVLFTDHAARPN